ncbi:MAG: LA2681 family HEPN domain-containing protein, partial [Ekhidna sp.]
TKRAIELTKGINPESQFPTKRTLFHYFISIAWSDIRIKNNGVPESWEWNHSEYEQEIIHLRNALKYFNPETIDHPVIRLCQIHTNLANSKDFCGRFVSAFENWNAAIDIDNQFAMALGAKGNSMIYHGLNSLYDKGHQSIYLGLGYQYLKQSIKHPLESYALKQYTDKIKYLGIKYPWVNEYDPNLNETENCSSEEKEYRDWCLNKTLFLNPLNDIGYFKVAKHDPFALPSMIIGTEKAGSYHSFFNQIKQEYVSSRLFLFKGLNDLENHFADKGVLKYDLLDQSIQSVKLEQVKISYRIAYSIFDKISYFLNYYLDLKIPERRVNFRSIWFDKNEELKDVFKAKPNLMFRALYWISKDLFYKNSDYTSALEPDAAEFAKIRNHIEHKGFRVFEDSTFKGLELPVFEDRISYSLSYNEFVGKTQKLLKLAREAIMYLSLGIRWEERIRSTSNDSDPAIQINVF